MTTHTSYPSSVLPTGTLTFLFTDIEGSTRLWEQYPNQMRMVMARHDALIESTVAQQSGFIVRPRGEGDSRFAVFLQATDALSAANAIQHALAAESWNIPSPLRVRIALHTGEAHLRDGDYYGTAVNRCARLRAIAYGGQTLISQITYSLVIDALPEGLSICDLGVYTLKDITRSEHIYQLVSAGLSTDFPPIRVQGSFSSYTKEKIHILIVDDHPLVRSGMQAVLRATDDVEVIGEAANGEEAISFVEHRQPDVIVMDLHMPGLNGIDATRQILKSNPQIHILILTLFDDDDSVFAALRAGARGYILKESNEVEVLRAIRSVHNGDAIFSAPIAQKVIDLFTMPRSTVAPPFPELTEPELEILRLIAQGRKNTEIGKTLAISLKVVRNYISSIFTKLQVADRAQAIILARSEGLG